MIKLEEKNSQLEKENADYKSREKDLRKMLYDQKAGYQTQLKNAAQQYEQKIAVLEKSIQLVTQEKNGIED